MRSNFVVAITFPRLLGAFKPQGAFGWYAGWNIIGFFAILLFVPETKALSLEELDQGNYLLYPPPTRAVLTRTQSSLCRHKPMPHTKSRRFLTTSRNTSSAWTSILYRLCMSTRVPLARNTTRLAALGMRDPCTFLLVQIPDTIFTCNNGVRLHDMSSISRQTL